MVLYDFGNHRECMNFAGKSIEIYLSKSETKYIDKVMDNQLVISKAHVKVGEAAEAVGVCEAIFEAVTKNSIWSPALGPYIVEALKTVYEVEMAARTYERRSLIYYIFDMLHTSFDSSKPVREPFFMEKIKAKCEDSRGLKNMLVEAVDAIYRHSSAFDVSNLMNTTYDRFLQANKSPDVSRAIDDMRLLYLCMGGDFLLHSLKPIT